MLLCLATALLLLGTALAPALRAEPSAPAVPTAAAVPAEAGSFRLAKVRILGVPVITVASPTVAGKTEGPDAAQRGRVIEGNLELLYRRRSLCSLGELAGEVALDGRFRGSRELACAPNHLGLLGLPGDLRVVVLERAGGGKQLAAEVSGRKVPFPLLSVTAADARLNGTTPDELAERWRSLLERRLQAARLQFTDERLRSRLLTAGALLLTLVAILGLLLLLWRRARRWILHLLERMGSRTDDPRHRSRLRLARLLTRLLLLAVLMTGVAIAAVLLLSWPGRVPQAIDLLLEPAAVLLTALLALALALLLRFLVALLLGQWATTPAVSAERRARRNQRHLSLLRVLRRLVDLTCLLLFLTWTVLDMPFLKQLPGGALLASGAVLGALAIVFQGLLRDFITGLVVLLDDRYAIGDTVEVAGHTGEVIDVGVLSTELRCLDQRVVVLPNAACDRVVNHTKLHSGAELTLPLPRSLPDLSAALEVITAELAAFAADPLWQPLLLKPPRLRGVSAVTAEGILVSVLLITQAGRQGEARRELLARLVKGLERAGVPLA